MVIFSELFGEKTVYLFDSHSKDNEGNISQNGSKNSSGNICHNGIAVSLKFETLSKLQEYVKDIYYVGLRHEMLYF